MKPDVCVYEVLAVGMQNLAMRLAGDIRVLAAGNHETMCDLTSRPIGEVLQQIRRAEAEGTTKVTRVGDLDAVEDSGAGVIPPPFRSLPEPVHQELHTDWWRDYLSRTKSLEEVRRRHDNRVANTRSLLRSAGLSDDLANPVLPGTPEFDRMITRADSDRFIYVVRPDGVPVIVPDRWDDRDFTHAGLILEPDDVVTAAGEVRIRGRAGDYEVPELNNRSGAFTPPPGTLSASALPTMERYGLFPQTITAHDFGVFRQVTYTR